MTMGIDPSTQQPMMMPQDGGQLPPELMEQQMGEQPQVDPNSPPADPMLQQPYGPQAPGEYETRERVELCVLLAMETCCKAIEVGVGASDKDMAVGFGQTAASLGQAYQALTGAEQAEKKPAAGPVGPSAPPSFPN